VFIEAKDDESGGDNWSYKSCKAPVKSAPPTNQHPVFLQAGCPSCHPTNIVKALKGKYHIPWTCLPKTCRYSSRGSYYKYATRVQTIHSRATADGHSCWQTSVTMRDLMGWPQSVPVSQRELESAWRGIIEFSAFSPWQLKDRLCLSRLSHQQRKSRWLQHITLWEHSHRIVKNHARYPTWAWRRERNGQPPYIHPMTWPRNLSEDWLECISRCTETTFVCHQQWVNWPLAGLLISYCVTWFLAS